VDLYREYGRRAGFEPEALKVGIHALGYCAATDQQAADDFFPGYAEAFTKIGRERGWPAVTRPHFDALLTKTGALAVGSPETVAEKVRHYDEVLGGIARFDFQMSVAALPHGKLMEAMRLIGEKVKGMVNG
jgi:alkanesulfonate monooxygenase SsuD/methylene tetrahydromethanopterin reductase-like flavin-dependent oxidoreductase (luciferase family)